MKKEKEFFDCANMLTDMRSLIYSTSKKTIFELFESIGVKSVHFSQYNRLWVVVPIDPNECDYNYTLAFIDECVIIDHSDDKSYDAENYKEIILSLRTEEDGLYSASIDEVKFNYEELLHALIKEVYKK